MSGGAREGAGRPKGTTKPESEKRKRIPMTTIRPDNYDYLMKLKADGFLLSGVLDDLIDYHKIAGTGIYGGSRNKFKNIGKSRKERV